MVRFQVADEIRFTIDTARLSHGPTTDFELMMSPDRRPRTHWHPTGMPIPNWPGVMGLIHANHEANRLIPSDMAISSRHGSSFTKLDRDNIDVSEVLSEILILV